MLRQGEEGCSSVAAGRSIWGQCLGHLLGTAGLGGAQPGAAVGRSPREQPGAAGGAVLQSWGGGNGPENAAPAEQGTRRDTSLPGKPAWPRWDVCLTRCSLSRQLEPSGCSRLAKSMRGGIQPRSHTPASPGGSGFGSALARSGSASPAHLGKGPRCPAVPPPLPARCGTSVPAGGCAEVGEQLPGAGSLPGESCSFSRSISRGWSDLRMAGQKFGERAVPGGGGGVAGVGIRLGEAGERSQCQHPETGTLWAHSTAGDAAGARVAAPQEAAPAPRWLGASGNGHGGGSRAFLGGSRC